MSTYALTGNASYVKCRTLLYVGQFWLYSDVINAADSLNFEASRVLTEGAQSSGTIIIHTSGIGLLAEDAQGMSLKVTHNDDADDVIPGIVL